MVTIEQGLKFGVRQIDKQLTKYLNRCLAYDEFHGHANC